MMPVSRLLGCKFTGFSSIELSWWVINTHKICYPYLYQNLEDVSAFLILFYKDCLQNTVLLGTARLENADCSPYS